MGDKYPPEGAEVKGILQLHLFKEAHIREGEPLNIELIHEEEPKGKDYEFMGMLFQQFKRDHEGIWR